MKTFQNVTLRFCSLIAALFLFTDSVQADPVLRGYWTFDNDTVDSGTITESAGYVTDSGTHIGLIKGTGVSYNPIVDEPGNHLNSGNYISFTDNTYAVIQNTSTVADLDSPNYLETYDFKGASFTISAWVKGLPDANWEPYIAKYGENNYGYQLRREGGNTHPTFTYRRSGGDDDPVPNIKGTYTNLNDGEWHNLVAVYGGTYRELYMDGQLITRIPDTVESAGGEGEPLVFSGRYNANSAAYEGFANISLDNVAIYSGALRNNQVSYISNGGDPTQIATVEAGTKTYSIPLNSPTADDGITLARNGNISRHWLDDDISFDGSSYLRTNLPVGSAGMNGSFTASAWVYLNSLSGDQSIFGNNATGNNNGLHLIVRDAHPHMGFYGNDLQASETLETGKWYYLTWQYDADAQSQTLYLNGNQIKTETGHTPFTGTNVLDLGTSMGGGYLNGKIKGAIITDAVLTSDQIKAQMDNPDTRRIENFEWGKNDEWYSGGGASVGNFTANYTKPTSNILSMYHAPSDGSPSTVYNQGNGTDATTGMLWGPQFTVLETASDDAVFTFDAVGGSTALDVTNRSAGGGGIALWDMTAGDYVRDGSGNVLYGNGNNDDVLKAGSISLKGLQGHNLMVVDIDRNPGGWGWVGLTNLTIDGAQVSAIADAAQHHIVLNNFNFDTAGEFSGMYEVDAEGNRLPSVSNFTNGSRGNGAITNYYVDESGSIEAGVKGFLSTGSVNGGEESSVGVLRSDPFLIQGDIMEYYISGGNNINNKHLDLVDADSGEVYRSATGNDTNDFKYDFWSLKGLEGKSVYIQVVDSDGGTSWSHLELDQIRQLKFAPTAAEVAAANNSLKSRNLPYYEVEPGFNADSYNLEGTGVSTLTDLANYIIGADATEKTIQISLDNYKASEDSPVGVNVLSVLNVESSGMYTLAVGNDEPYKITLNGSTLFESEGSDDLEFIPLMFSEVGQYALNLLYLDQSDEGASLYLAEGGYDAWNSSFSLLAGYGDGYVLAYAQNVDANKIPEPSTWALLILGAAGMLYWRKRNASK